MRACWLVAQVVIECHLDAWTRVRRGTQRHDLDRLIRTHRLPSGTRDRLRRTLQPPREFPELGANLGDPFEAYRFVLGPWRWMIVIYGFDEADDPVAVMAIVDGRTSTSPTANG